MGTHESIPSKNAPITTTNKTKKTRRNDSPKISNAKDNNSPKISNIKDNDNEKQLQFSDYVKRNYKILCLKPCYDGIEECILQTVDNIELYQGSIIPLRHIVCLSGREGVGRPELLKEIFTNNVVKRSNSGYITITTKRPGSDNTIRKRHKIMEKKYNCIEITELTKYEDIISIIDCQYLFNILELNKFNIPGGDSISINALKIKYPVVKSKATIFIVKSNGLYNIRSPLVQNILRAHHYIKNIHTSTTGFIKQIAFENKHSIKNIKIHPPTVWFILSINNIPSGLPSTLRNSIDKIIYARVPTKQYRFDFIKETMAILEQITVCKQYSHLYVPISVETIHLLAKASVWCTPDEMYSFCIKGMEGFIKAILSLKKKKILPNKVNNSGEQNKWEWDINSFLKQSLYHDRVLGHYYMLDPSIREGSKDFDSYFRIMSSNLDENDNNIVGATVGSTTSGNIQLKESKITILPQENILSIEGEKEEKNTTVVNNLEKNLKRCPLIMDTDQQQSFNKRQKI